MTTRVLSILFAVGWAVAATAADEAVTIKLKKLAAGDVVSATKTDDATETTTVTAGGKEVQKQEDKSSTKTVFTDEVLATDGTSSKPTKLKRTYETADAVRKGLAAQLGLAGQTVLIEKGKEKYAYTVDGKPLTGLAADLLDREFNRPGMAAFEDVMLPKKAVKVGEKWDVEAAVLAKLFEEQMTIDKDKTKVSGKLIKTYEKGGAKHGTIEFTLDLVVTELKSPMGALPATAGSTMSFVVTMDGCIDGSEYGGTSSGSIKGDIGVKLPQADIKVGIDGTMKSTTGPKKK